MRAVPLKINARKRNADDIEDSDRKKADHTEDSVTTKRAAKEER